MKETDKFLLGIVVAIILLVVAAFAITLARPEAAYQVEDTADGVAHNYLLALQQQDYERAYGYLSPTLTSYPASADEFVRDVQNDSGSFRLDSDTTLIVEETTVSENRATVTVRESRFSGGDLFDSGVSSTTFKLQMVLAGGEWRIVDSRYYFARCWTSSNGCR